MSGLFRKPSPPVIYQQQAAPITEATPDVKEAARLEAERMRKRKGFASTILTGPSGLTKDPDLLKTTLG